MPTGREKKAMRNFPPESWNFQPKREPEKTRIRIRDRKEWETDGDAKNPSFDEMGIKESRQSDL